MAFSRSARTAQRKVREANRGENVAAGWEAEAKRAGFENPMEAFPGGEEEFTAWNEG
jgi:hypothetical protein